MKSPFLESRHEVLAEKVRTFGDKRLRPRVRGETEVEAEARELVTAMGVAGLLAAAVPPPQGIMDLRSLVVVREGLAYFSGLADASFATQALGCLPIALAGTEVQRNRWLPAVAAGDMLAAFAVTEPEAGSDLASARTRAERDGAVWRLEGVKTLVSNAGIAGVYTVLARSGSSSGRDGLSMFLVDGEAPGMRVKALETLSPRPMGEIRFEAAPAVLLGSEGRGYAIALEALDRCRPAVGAAACGIAGRALHEARRFALSRRQFGRPIAGFQAIRMALAEIHVEIEAARLLVLSAAWSKDVHDAPLAKDAASAKLFATEMAQRSVDRALQIHGGQGILRGATVERLYREVRSLRIEEGTSEIQKLIVARELMKDDR